MGDRISHSMSISADSPSDETLNRGPLAQLLWRQYEFAFGIIIVNFYDEFSFLFMLCSDPRFIIGVLLFVIGYVINRWADWKLRSLRNKKGDHTQLPSSDPDGLCLEKKRKIISLTHSACTTVADKSIITLSSFSRLIT